jgi:hypothetical protein
MKEEHIFAKDKNRQFIEKREIVNIRHAEFCQLYFYLFQSQIFNTFCFDEFRLVGEAGKLARLDWSRSGKSGSAFHTYPC